MIRILNESRIVIVLPLSLDLFNVSIPISRSHAASLPTPKTVRCSEPDVFLFDVLVQCHADCSRALVHTSANEEHARDAFAR